jgi:hypothetical protein
MNPITSLSEYLDKDKTNKSSTPETDAVTMQPVDGLARAYTFHGTKPFNYSNKELVPAEFARELERERDKLKEHLQMCKVAEFSK